MANRKHLARLQRSVEEWNQWREENPGVQIDLSEANLDGADLTVTSLRGADLQEANLYDVDLQGAKLNLKRCAVGIDLSTPS